jgi:hypothetical protein
MDNFAAHLQFWHPFKMFWIFELRSNTEQMPPLVPVMPRLSKGQPFFFFFWKNGLSFLTDPSEIHIRPFLSCNMKCQSQVGTNVPLHFKSPVSGTKDFGWKCDFVCMKVRNTFHPKSFVLETGLKKKAVKNGNSKKWQLLFPVDKCGQNQLNPIFSTST